MYNTLEMRVFKKKKETEMKKTLTFLILVGLILVISGCVNQQDQWAWQRALQNFSRQYQATQQQNMYDAQYNYYTRPYEMGGVTYIPAR